jgi:hypothetical protein
MARHQEVNRQRLAEEDARRRRASARALAGPGPSERDARVGEHVAEQQGAESSCVMCQKALNGEDRAALLQRSHTFHFAHVDEWTQGER